MRSGRLSLAPPERTLHDLEQRLLVVLRPEAVANAVEDALPITPERVWRWMAPG